MHNLPKGIGSRTHVSPFIARSRLFAETDASAASAARLHEPTNSLARALMGLPPVKAKGRSESVETKGDQAAVSRDAPHPPAKKLKTGTAVATAADRFAAAQKSRLTHALNQPAARPTQRSGLKAIQMELGSSPDDGLSVSSAELDELCRQPTSSVGQLAIAIAAFASGRGKTCSSRPLVAVNDALPSSGFIDAFVVGRRNKRKPHRSDALLNKALDAATASGDRGRNSVGVRAWFSFCENEMNTSAERPMDPNSPLWARLEEEWLAMRFICSLVEDRGVSPDTARQYFSSVQGWHAREFGVKLAGGLALERIPQMVKGLRRLGNYKPKKIRRGVSPSMLQRAMDKCLDPTNPLHANVRAAFATALQGLLRSAEYCGDQGKKTLLRGDIQVLDLDKVILMMHPCKNMKHISGKTCPLIVGAGGQHVDAVAELHNLRRVDPSGDDSPLFRDPATNKPLAYNYMLDMVKKLMTSIGEPPEHFGTHSMRIGGATALFAQGASDMVIRTMGRWSSDCHQLYVRACYEQCLAWTKKAGSATSTSVQADFDEVDNY